MGSRRQTFRSGVADNFEGSTSARRVVASCCEEQFSHRQVCEASGNRDVVFTEEGERHGAESRQGVPVRKPRCRTRRQKHIRRRAAHVSRRGHGRSVVEKLEAALLALGEMLGLIDEASSKRPWVAVGVGASASKIRSTFAKFGLRSIRVGEASRSRFDPDGSQERCPVKSGFLVVPRRIDWFSVRSARYGLRGFRVGEASHPGPPRTEKNADFTPYTDSSRFTVVESEAASENQRGCWK